MYLLKPITRINNAGTFSKNSGVTLIEFTFVFVIFLLALGVFFDLGLMIHNWMLLRHVVIKSNREIAAGLITKPDCDTIPKYLKQTSTTRLRNELNASASPGELKWCWNIRAIASGSMPSLQISGEFPVPCFFLCSFTNLSWKVRSSSETVIELQQMPDSFKCANSCLTL